MTTISTGNLSYSTDPTAAAVRVAIAPDAFRHAERAEQPRAIDPQPFDVDRLYPDLAATDGGTVKALQSAVRFAASLIALAHLPSTFR